MRFKPSDYDWSDWHQGLSRERRKRYKKILDAIVDGVEVILKKYHNQHHIMAQIPEGIFSTGTRGDGRAYTPIVFLTIDQSLNKEMQRSVIDPITNEICNTLPVCRVTVRVDSYLKQVAPNVYQLV